MNEEITTAERLREVPGGSVIRDRQGLVYEKSVGVDPIGREWAYYYQTGQHDGVEEGSVELPALLLWVGGVA